MKIIYDTDITFHITCVLCLMFSAWLIKKTIKKFPYELIPLLLVFISVIITAIYFNRFQDITEWNMRLSDGLTNGLAAVGLHQAWKQTKRYFAMKNMKKLMKKDKRKRSRLVS